MSNPEVGFCVHPHNQTTGMSDEKKELLKTRTVQGVDSIKPAQVVSFQICFLKHIVLALFVVFINTQLFAQSNEEKNALNSVQFGLAASPVLSGYRLGSAIEFNHMVRGRYFTGLRFFVNSTTTNDTFGMSIQKPTVSFVELGWNNGFQFYRTDKVKFSASLSNNVCLVRLGDNAERTFFITEDGVVSMSKEIETDYIYSLVPSVEASFRIYNSMFLTTSIKYRQSFGAPFTDVSQFNGFVYGVGLTFFLE
jgi:hypothetical protein